MKYVVALLASLVLALSGISAHATGMTGFGVSSSGHHASAEAHECSHESSSHESISAFGEKAEKHGPASGCVVGHCAVACGFLPFSDIEVCHQDAPEIHRMAGEAQTDGLDLSFDPPPPRT